MTADVCTIVTEFLGINLGPCGREATHTTTGRCGHGHTRTRPICVLHTESFQANPPAIMCEQCDGEGRETQMAVQVGEVTP
ncbi:hypothetical protein GCM10011608_11070 [Micromonospora sonchi]|uniref:Uncharacterized protein n=1 Tax=Micromonospora sonchi TaxID=1763543 RepID=A0A917WTS6_9ACTN|nr:hypothetical protein [Micromonospora sonchi]GGM27999.1 hypothetical protein GCM10011608_11070 [Micromonospora sonchi]